jgi:hypothetical protein
MEAKAQLRTLVAASSLCLTVTGCDRGSDAEAAWLEFDWPEADSLFQRDGSWVGADGAYSIDLGDGRVLWLFGDSWIDPTDRGRRRGASMVSNTLGVQQGYDPTQATARFFWQTEPDGTPAAFFPDSGGLRYWPGHGVKLGDRLVLFLMVVEPTTNGLGFEVGDWDAVLVRNPDEDPTEWEIKWLETPPNRSQIIIGSGSVLREAGYIYAFGAQEPAAPHDVYLARWREEEVLVDRLDGMEWWGGDEEGWVAHRDEGLGARPVFGDGQTEFTVHYDQRSREFVEIQTVGFGPAAVVRRTAPHVTGPWSAPDTVFMPPQVEFPRIMIYQGKAHPHLEGAELILTYCTNSFELGDHLTQDWLYYPRFVRVDGPSRLNTF